MAQVIETFELSHGPAGQAAGTIESDGSTVTFTGVSGTVYEMDISSGSDYESGLISIQHADTGRYPVYQAGVGTRDSAGSSQNPGVASVVVDSAVITDNVLVVTYTDTIDGTPRTRTHTFSVVGDAIKVRVQGSSTSYNSNYSGLYGGAFSGSGLAILEAPGSVSMPQAYYTSGGQTYWFAKFIDISRSKAQFFTIGDPSTALLSITYSTMNHYLVNTAGVLPSSLDDTLWCIVSDTRRDTFMHPNAATEHRDKVASGPWCYITSNGDGFIEHYNTLKTAHDDWGFDALNIYVQFWWALYNYPALGQNNGSSWEIGAPALHATFGSEMYTLGFLTGVYTYNTLEKEGTANYDASDRVLNDDGTPRESEWEAGTWLRKTEFVTDKFTAQMVSIISDLRLAFVRFDVDTYAAPVGAGGNHIDADATSTTQTLQSAIQGRRRWQYECKALTREGFAFGEGGRANYNSDLEILHAGSCDSMHTWFNTNSGYDELPSPDPSVYPEERTISNWPMMLEHEWFARWPYFQHTNNNPARFFTYWDSDLQDDGVVGVYPHSRAMMSRQRCYSIAMGRTGSVPLVESWTHYMPKAEVLKEYYLTNAVCRAINARFGETVQVHYHDDTNGFETEDEKFTRAETVGAGRGRLDFVETRVRIRVGAAEIFVNRSTTDWTIASSLSVVLPPDGFFVADGPNYYGSFKSDTLTGGQTVDVVYVSGSYLLVDGRGTDVTYLGVDAATGGLLYMEDYAREFTLTEESDGSITRGTLPAQADMTSSYATVAQTDTYNSDYVSVAAWTSASTAEKERALRLATQYIDAKFGLAWQGTRTSSTQDLDWPRYDVYVGGHVLDSSVVPDQVVNACCELAIKAISDDTLFDDETSPGHIVEKMVRAGAVTKKTVYAGGSSQQTKYTLAYKLLRPLLAASQAVRS